MIEMNNRTSASRPQAVPVLADEVEAAVFTAVSEYGPSNVVSTSETLRRVRALVPSCASSDEEIVAHIVQVASGRSCAVCFDHRARAAQRPRAFRR
jgi:hypothetical protein